MSCSPIDRMDGDARLGFTNQMMSLQARHAAEGQREAALVGPGAGWYKAALVTVRPEWNAWRTAMVRWTDLEGVHWSQPIGAPRQLLHAYVSPKKLLSGNILDQAQAASPRIKVCLLRCDTLPSVFQALSQRADSAAPGRLTLSSQPLASVSPNASASAHAPLVLLGVGVVTAAAAGALLWRRRGSRGDMPDIPTA
jgi:hypothetical protein